MMSDRGLEVTPLVAAKPASCICRYRLAGRVWIRAGQDPDCPWHLLRLTVAHRDPHYCRECGRCLCSCSGCALLGGCCCEECMNLNPVHRCTCAPVRRRPA
jgi:hypothetical protein